MKDNKELGNRIELEDDDLAGVNGGQMMFAETGAGKPGKGYGRSNGKGGHKGWGNQTGFAQGTNLQGVDAQGVDLQNNDL